MKHVYCLLVLFVFSFPPLFCQEWEKIKEEDEITVSLRILGKHTKEFKSTFIIQSSLSGAAGFLLDESSYNDWITNITEVKLHKKVSEQKMYYRIKTALPPFIKRESIVKTTVFQKNDNNNVFFIMEQTELPGVKLEHKQIKPFKIVFLIKPLNEEYLATHMVFSGEYDKEYNDFIDAMLEKIMVNSFFKLSKNMQDLVKNEKYQKHKLSFIRD
jgi:hypothetical protein